MLLKRGKIMSNLARAISDDGSAFVICVDSTKIVQNIEQIHKTSAVVSAALGRLSTASALMGALLKSENDSITLRFDGDGPAGSLIAVADSKGNVKACVDQPIVEIPLKSNGKLDVSSAVGTNGTLSVVRDAGMGEPYCGQVPIVSGEIAEDITNYYATSEQTPTVCGLGVLVNPDLTIKSAGGFLVQLLPFADEACIDVIEENVKKLPPVSSLFEKGLTPQEVAFKLLEGLNPNILDKSQVNYNCDCSEDRVRRMLYSLGKDEIKSMIDDKEPVKVDCHFCNKNYEFNTKELEKIQKQF